MTVDMGSYIEIGKYGFANQLHSAKIISGRKEFGDRATLQFPNIKGMLDKVIKAGDAVVIKLGYDGDLHEEFRGYVRSVSPKIPLTIECEDEFYQLKRQPIEAASWETVKLKDLIAYIAPGATVTVHDITLSSFRIDDSVRSRAEALEKLKAEYGLDAYYQQGKLYVGLAYGSPTTPTKEVVYQFDGVVANAKMGDMEFRRSDEVLLQVKAISLSRDNEKREVVVGDKNGETRTLHFYNKTAAELKALATDQLDKLKYDGYRGSFKAKGLPLVQHGMVADLRSEKYPERAGKYFIDGVTTTYNGSDGFSRAVTLGLKAS